MLQFDEPQKRVRCLALLRTEDGSFAKPTEVKEFYFTAPVILPPHVQESHIADYVQEWAPNAAIQPGSVRYTHSLCPFLNNTTITLLVVDIDTALCEHGAVNTVPLVQLKSHAERVNDIVLQTMLSMCDDNDARSSDGDVYVNKPRKALQAPALFFSALKTIWDASANCKTFNVAFVAGSVGLIAWIYTAKQGSPRQCYSLEFANAP